MSTEIHTALAAIYDSLQSDRVKNAFEKDASILKNPLLGVPTASTPGVDVPKDYIIKKYLTPSNNFSSEWLDRLQELPPVDKLQFVDQLFSIPDYESHTGLRFKRSGLEGNIVGYEEFEIRDHDSESQKTSLSLNRPMGSRLDFVRGRAGFMPFTPGGIDVGNQIEDKLALHRDENGLYDIAPGMSRGLITQTTITMEESKDLTKYDEDENVEDQCEEEFERAMQLDSDNNLSDEATKDGFSVIDDFLPMEISFGRAKTSLYGSQVVKKAKEWAHVVDVNKKIENFDMLVPNPARVFPFELDIFQKEAVYHLEQGDSVFVAAHTSAGKTVVAEYAISMASRNMTKVIYTSPIKALSNQKYRDFRQIYDDVGILTGDVQINPEASCLIMTTEILRSMLYRGADLIRDVEFVIFDEVHYVNDQDRGVVWEEVIIMLPDHVKFILLSATVPNTYEFANWIGRTKQKDIYVISTPKRPVPLVHYLWAKGKMFKIVDEYKTFHEDAWKKANNELSPAKEVVADNGNSDRGGRGGARGGSPARGGRGGSRGGGGGSGGRGGSSFNSQMRNSGRNMNQNLPGKTAFMQLCQYLQKNTLLPAVIFVFSKKRCEEFAQMLTGIDYCNHKEKSEVYMFIDKAVSRLKKEDRELPQIMNVRELLSRGIGVHHGGLLPIVKEVIEILFSKSLVKVLFATETFAMGLNLPTKTVVYAMTRKHDGHTFRSLLPGEYTQMAGRAGRRGLDTEGTVIIMTTPPEAPSINGLKDMMLGAPTKLQSQFRLTYNMILNLLRIEALKVEEMIKRSFSENASQVMLPEHEQNVKMNEETLLKMKRKPCTICDQDIDNVHDMLVQYQKLGRELLTELVQSAVGRKILAPGRLIVYKVPGSNRELGIITRSRIQQEKLSVYCTARIAKGQEDKLPYLTDIASYTKHLTMFELRRKGFEIKTIDFDDVEMVTRLDVSNTISVKDLPVVTRQIAEHLEYQRKWREINWDNLKNRNVRLTEILTERKNIYEQIKVAHSVKCPTFKESFSQTHEQYLIREKIDALKHLISDQNLELLPDYEQRIGVLKDLNYIDESSNVQLKGRVACEVSNGFELIVTELILDNFLGDYEPEEIVALMSVFVFEGNTKTGTESVTPRLERGKKRISEIVEKVNKVYEAHQVLVTQEEAEFLEKQRFGLMEAVYEWARGMSFHNITQLTDVPEGTIVRVISRLDEVCRQVMAASRIVGDTALYDKMAEAQEKIKRDIVFCASLYI